MIKFKGTKILASALAITSMLTLGSFKANAEWKEEPIGWKYNTGDTFATGWQNIGQDWYFFDDNGYMVSNKYIDGFYLGSNGAMIGGTGVADPFSNADSIKKSMPITVPDGWSVLNSNLYKMNYATLLMYDKRDTLGKKERSIISDIQSTLKNKRDFKEKMKTFNGHNAYCYEYSEFNGDEISKFNLIFIFKDNTVYAFTMISDEENFYTEKTELESVLKSSLNI
ncbi:hypothetical protein [Clostridium sp. SM-530-WT-3G]|uniref:hypothetical protein n=1 Tax=Clostridium sp. SM-530-WT-3G TaxID=2725303 RepID=UPI00145F997F|nr:hypothetical protein [Clostridium sp. SM-530-WT-3G]NME83320.1 hypothetical protein [Clostridium sp. SM-530-WT-3G]